MTQREFCDTCEEACIHPKAICEAKEHMISSDMARTLADFYKVIGDATRVRILSLLMTRELCVCDITEALEMAQSAVSHQLRILRAAHLVTYRKEGKMSYYRLDDDHVTELLRQGIEHLTHKGELK
ncbi:MAG: helix-turn-helix transcriptional regulator [Selenomonadales bacterium]|nr:helix-turn-helix transcriptional regulator [Selenomonadales bacterium]